MMPTSGQPPKAPPPPPDTSVRGDSARVRFDFEGSLATARKLHALAATLRTVRDQRKVDAEVARRAWQGKFRTDFDLRMTEEEKSLWNTINNLEEEARYWAERWQAAMDDQNRRNRAKQIDVVRAQRSWMETGYDQVVGGDDSEKQVGAARVVPMPLAPLFTAPEAEMAYQG